MRSVWTLAGLGALAAITAVTGDFFESVPASGDAYLLRHVLHDFGDKECLRILANVREAMLPHARILIIEAPLPVDDSPGPGRWLDLHMMLLSGGRERTTEEYSILLGKAGLRLDRIVPTRHPAIAILEAVASA